MTTTTESATNATPKLPEPVRSWVYVIQILEFGGLHEDGSDATGEERHYLSEAAVIETFATREQAELAAADFDAEETNPRIVEIELIQYPAA
jgi:hypothetical protein